MAAVTEMLGANRSSLFLHNPETNELFSRVIRGSVVGEVRFAAARGIAGSMFARVKGKIIADVDADPLFNPDMDQRTGYRTRNFLCVPIRNRRQEVIGITQALNKHGGDFNAEDQQLLGILSQQAASALENARVFEKVERAQHEEALLREIDFIRVRRLNWPLAVFKALHHHTDQSFAQRAGLLQAYAEGLRLYRLTDWAHAADCFRATSMANRLTNPRACYGNVAKNTPSHHRRPTGMASGR